MEREPDFNNAEDNLEEKDRAEIKEINKILMEFHNSNPDLPIKDKKIKKRLAELCLRLVNKTPKDDISIEETSYILTNFIFLNYEDELDNIISNFGELELPRSHVNGDVFERWEENKKMIEDYLKNF